MGFKWLIVFKSFLKSEVLSQLTLWEQRIGLVVMIVIVRLFYRKTTATI
jgi:hypothetical protein